MSSAYNNLCTAEPLQWAVDYLLGILETLEEAPADSEYGLGLLALEREELRTLWHQVSFRHKDALAKAPAFCGYNREGACLFVLRQLLAALPAVKHCPLHGMEELYLQACKRLVDEFFFMSGFRLSLEKKAPRPALLLRALRILEEKDLLGALRLNGHPLHIYCLDYEMPDPAYYLYPSHTIICGAVDYEAGRQLHMLLHELGHAVFAAQNCERPAGTAAKRKETAEQFAHQFAASHLTLV